jgi:hypothetical protein
MKLKYLALLGLAFALACKKDDNPSFSRYVTSIVSPFDSTLIKYNSDHTVSRLSNFNRTPLTIGDITMYFMQYANGKYSGMKVYYYDLNGSAEGTPDYYVIYNNSGNPEKVIYNHPAGNGFYDSLVYDNLQQVKERYTFNNFVVNQKYQYTWENNNVAKVELSRPDSGDIETTWKFTYDDKPNVYAPLKIMTYQGSFGNHFYYYSANNVIKTEVTFSQYPTKSTTDIEYEYNKDNYPVQIKSTTIFAYDNGYSTTVDVARVTY